MIFAPLICLVVASLAPSAYSQDTSSLVGTWSSGSKNVQTGSGFANPANETFKYPPTTGISYSFTQDGYYEIARYRFTSNGSQPTCITGVMNWVHGTFVQNANGSLSMTPINDGYQQIQDPCAAVSNFIENYNDTEYYTAWAITVDPTFGPKLQLYQFDGSPLAPQFQISTTPNMLPTTQLRNLPSATATSGASRRSLEKKSNDAPSSHIAIALAATAGMMSLSVVAFLL